MRELTLDEKRENLVNDIIILNRMVEDLWQYHPDNKDKIDIVKSYSNIQAKIREKETEIEGLD
jgi:hypothetical protein